jgi:uncharacterized protein (TIGR03435 family)
VNGGPGTADPTRITYEFATLKLLVMQACALPDYQVSGPDWIESERYTITANVPAGASKEQLRAMLRSLLEERFKLKVHHETKTMPVYELTVAKGGSKLRVSRDDAKEVSTSDPFAGVKMVDGVPQYPPGSIGMMQSTGMIAAAHQPLSVLTTFLTGRMRMSPTDVKPVIDKTGLTGNYDFSLRFTPPVVLLSANPNNRPSDPASDVFSAVQQDLGLKLEEKKDPLDTVVIDEAEKVPTAN